MSEIVAIFMAICAYYGHKLAKKHSDVSCYTPPVFLGLKYRHILNDPPYCLILFGLIMSDLVQGATKRNSINKDNYEISIYCQDILKND